jgi:hypothetical protein
MNITNPDQDALASFVKGDFTDSLRGINFNDLATDMAEDHNDSAVEYDELTETSSGCDKDNIFIPTVNRIVDNPEIINKKTKDDKYVNHAKLLGEVHDLLSLLEQEEVPVPEKFKKLANKPGIDVQQLRQLKAALSDLHETNTTALYFTDWILQGAVMISSILNGEHAIPFTDIKPNLSGYSTKLKKQTAELNKENMRIARKVNDKLGKSTMSIFKWFSLIVLPAIITIGNNHGAHKMIDCDKHNELDSDDSEESGSEDGSDEESRESEYVSD